jgi:HEAT repeat protein
MRILRSDPERAPLVDSLLDRVAVPRLTADTPPETRLRAALLTANRDPATAQPILLAYAENGDDQQLRARAILAMSESGNEKAIPTLRRIAGTSDTATVIMACRALGALRARGVRVTDDDVSACVAPGGSNRPNR